MAVEGGEGTYSLHPSWRRRGGEEGGREGEGERKVSHYSFKGSGNCLFCFMQREDLN